jgi:hypothetical protein
MMLRRIHRAIAAGHGHHDNDQKLDGDGVGAAEMARQ